MSFVLDTGRSKMQKCFVCGIEVEHRELRFMHPTGTTWPPVPHRAPCGAQCSGGGYAGDADTHMPFLKPCPRCGATQSEIIRVIERPGGPERVVFHRFKKEYSDDQGFWAVEERWDGELWRRVMHWELGHPESFDKALEQAREHVTWLGAALLSSILARGARKVQD